MACGAGDQAAGHHLGGQHPQRLTGILRQIHQPLEVLDEGQLDRLLGHGFHEQVLDIQHLLRHPVQHPAKQRMLLAGQIAAQDVIEQEFLHHGGHHQVHLRPRLVHHHLPKAFNFRKYRELNG